MNSTENLEANNDRGKDSAGKGGEGGLVSGIRDAASSRLSRGGNRQLEPKQQLRGGEEVERRVVGQLVREALSREGGTLLLLTNFFTTCDHLLTICATVRRTASVF